MEVLLFGLIAERAGTDRLAVEADTLSVLRATLKERIPQLAEMSYAIAVDRTIIHGEMSLTGSEEIAVLPPFAGG